MMSIVEASSRDCIPFQLESLPMGEAIRFDQEKILEYLLKAYGLYENGKERER